MHDAASGDSSRIPRSRRGRWSSKVRQGSVSEATNKQLDDAAELQARRGEAGGGRREAVTLNARAEPPGGNTQDGERWWPEKNKKKQKTDD